MANKPAGIDPKLLDELLKGQDPQKVFQQDGLLGELKQALAERMLDTEMDVHLTSEDEQAAGNHRNGRSGKTVLTDTGTLPLTIPRDRHGRFEPKLIEKYKRRFPGFDEKIIALYASAVEQLVKRVGDADRVAADDALDEHGEGFFGVAATSPPRRRASCRIAKMARMIRLP